MSANDRLQISEELLTRLKNYMNDPVYKETVENSSSYNERLVKERKLRLPFIDAQTGVAQSDCYIWSSKLDRMPGYYSAQLYSYPARRWRKKRRQYLLNESYHSNSNSSSTTTKEPETSNCNIASSTSQESNPPSANSFLAGGGMSTVVAQNGNGVTVNNGTLPLALNDTFEDSKESWMRDYDDGSDLPDAGELDDPESDFDDYEEYSSRKKKSKRKDTLKRKRSDYSDAEKPYQCDLCGARYKTRPGLSYHYSHSHQEAATGNGNGNGAIAGNGLAEEDVIFGGSSAAPLTNTQPPASQTNATGHPNLQSSQQSPLHPSQSNHMQNSTPSKPLNSADDKEKKDSKVPNKSPLKYCDFCLGTEAENFKTNEPEEMVSCADCGRSAHPTCLQFTANMITSVKKYRWQCIECKSCGLCGTSDNDEQLLFCDDCDRGYHMYCLKPPLTEPPEGSWSCHLCIVEYHSSTPSSTSNG